jgi:hypothetical protein
MLFFSGHSLIPPVTNKKSMSHIKRGWSLQRWEEGHEIAPPCMTKAYSTRWLVCLSVMSWLTFCFRHCYFPRGRAQILYRKILLAEKNGAIKTCIMKNFTGGFQKGKALTGMVTYDGCCGCETWCLLWRKNIKLLKMKRNLLYIRNQSVPRCKHFPPRL